MRARNSAADSATRKMLLVPANRSLQSLVEVEQRRPAEDLPRLSRAEVLVADFVGRLVAHVRFQRRADQPSDAAHEVQYRYLDFIGEIERLAAQGRIGRQP